MPASEQRGRRPRRASTPRRARALASGLLGALLGCSGPPGAGRSLGSDLGTFYVRAEQTSNGCGAGALGSAPAFEFDVELARADSELFWDGRVGGSIDASLGFEFASRVRVAVRTPRGADAGCAFVRDDVVSGTLAADAAGSPVAFSGVLRYGFSTEPGSACSFDDQVTAGLPALPCELAYALTAQRSRAPEPPSTPTSSEPRPNDEATY